MIFLIEGAIHKWTFAMKHFCATGGHVEWAEDGQRTKEKKAGGGCQILTLLPGPEGVAHHHSSLLRFLLPLDFCCR